MKTNQMMVMGLAALCAVALAGEASARGGNGGGSGSGGGSGMKVRTQTKTQSETRIKTQTKVQTKAQDAVTGASTKPADSQRRDGAFLAAGTTANGSTVRPGNGKGLQDGSGLTVPTTVAPE